MDFHLLTDEPIGNRIAVGIDSHITLHIYGSIRGLIDRGEIGRKGYEVRFFHQVGRFRAHAQRAFHLLVGHFLRPSFGLLVEVMPIRKGAARKKIIFCIVKVSFHFSFSISIADGMGNEIDRKNLAEPFDLRCDFGLGARAMSDDDAGVVNDTSQAGAFHEPKGRIEKDPGLEASEGRVILDKEFPGVTEDQPRTLGLDFLVPEEHLVGRGIVLHLLAWAKLISSRTAFLLILSQIEVSHDPGQSAVGDGMAAFAFEDLLNPHDIALRAFEYLLDDGRKLLVGRWSLRSPLPLAPDHSADRVSGELKGLADLSDLHPLLIKTQDGLLRLLGDHGNHTS
jgi:hypothetical protein